jgi:hypothetical protein
VEASLVEEETLEEHLAEKEEIQEAEGTLGWSVVQQLKTKHNKNRYTRGVCMYSRTIYSSINHTWFDEWEVSFSYLNLNDTTWCRVLFKGQYQCTLI